MDFHPQKNFYDPQNYRSGYSVPAGIPIPFFMAYPNAMEIWQGGREEQNKTYRDFEYIQQTYPEVVRNYRCRVREILNTLDYEGSMIYDEYPDKLAMQSLGLSVAKTILKEEAAEAARRSEKTGKRETMHTDDKKTGDPEEKYAGSDTFREALIQVLVCDEIYSRRQKNRS